MTDSIELFQNGTTTKLSVEQHHSSKIQIGKYIEIDSNFKFTIKFKSKIKAFRNHDYTWKDLKTDYTFNPYCPKAIVLEDGLYIQPNFNIGIWEINAKNPFELIWEYQPSFANPIVNYDNQNLKEISGANYFNADCKKLALLISKNNSIDVSRSKIPFVATACFTDHCDFDTLENLKIQRDFFRKHNVKVSKGFFLNHFSKRNDNASYERDSEEIDKWRQDGHEIVYHSLTQSIRENKIAIQEFVDFTPPFKIETWIDHGFQPYNLTLFKRSTLSEKEYQQLLNNKGINNLWNYLDSGTATFGVLNQLNTAQFNLQSYLQGIKSFPLKIRAQLFLKLLLMHYFSKPVYQKVYKNLSSSYKNVRNRKSLKNVFELTKNVLSFTKIGFTIALNWSKIKNVPFEHAKYAPVLFKHRINSETFTIFQTLEMVDFTTCLKRKSVDSFINEKGLFIAHTYFSVPMQYHTGRLIINNTINPKVEENFTYLSEQIKLNKIWNPTLNELALYLNDFEKVELDINEEGTIHCLHNFNYNTRTA